MAQQNTVKNNNIYNTILIKKDYRMPIISWNRYDRICYFYCRVARNNVHVSVERDKQLKWFIVAWSGTLVALWVNACATICSNSDSNRAPCPSGGAEIGVTWPSFALKEFSHLNCSIFVTSDNKWKSIIPYNYNFQKHISKIFTFNEVEWHVLI